MDFVVDQNPVGLYRAEAIVGMPDYVRNSPTITPEGLTGLYDQAFASPDKRLFPVFDKVSTWLSAAYFYGSGLKDSEAEARIKTAAVLHNIVQDVDTLQTKLTQEVKSASAPVKRYALVVDYKGEGGRDVEGYYPINTVEEIVESAASMSKSAAEQILPVEFFRSAAMALVKEAKSAGIEPHRIHDSVWSIGEDRIPNFDAARAAAETRKWAGVGAEDIQLLKDVVDVAEAEPERVDDCINLWLDLDSSHQVKYSRTVPDPYRAFYSGMETQALEKLARENVVIGNTLIPAVVVAKPLESTIRHHFCKASAETILTAQNQALENVADASETFTKLSNDEHKTFLSLLLKL